MPTVMKDLKYLLIPHNISQQFLCKVKRLNITIQVHPINIYQEGIISIVQLYHFNIPILS